MTAVYSGDKNSPAGTSKPTSIVVNPVPVNQGVACWNASFPYGDNYQCTVSASSNAGSAQGVITYSFDGGAAVPVTIGNGSAQFTLTKPLPGTHTVTIAYAQQTNYAAASAPTQSFTVTPAPVVVALTPSSYYTSASGGVSFAASVSSYSAGAPNAIGAVSFYDGSNLLATVPVNASGQASYTTKSLSTGSQTITASYSGAEAAPKPHIHAALIAAIPLDCSHTALLWRKMVSPRYPDAAIVKPYRPGILGIGYVLKQNGFVTAESRFSDNIAYFAPTVRKSLFRSNSAERRQRRRIRNQTERGA